MAETRGSAELRSFIKQFKKFPQDQRQAMRPKLRKIGGAALAGVRAEAAWSRKIPKATRLSIQLSKKVAGVSITVNRKRAEHGRPYNHNDEAGSFRAPLFGDRKRWFEHPARPFLVSGARPHFEQVDNDIKAAVDEAARAAGFR